jgi:Glycosyl hydrolase family 99
MIGNRRKTFHFHFFIFLLFLLVFSACQTDQQAKTALPTKVPTEVPTAAQNPFTIPAHVHQEDVTATATGGATKTPTAVASPQVKIPPPTEPNNNGKPVLAFYYPWYSTTTWCSCKMSDLPTVQYNSSDDATIERELTWAANAGITGFISSWWGPGDQTDTNFVKLLSHAAALEARSQYHFASSIYFESDAPALQGSTNAANGLSYLLSHYGNDPHFFHWQGHPVIFFWDPLGNGRTLSYWAAIRQQVDPEHQMIWSAEGVSTDLLTVFDGLHLFSGGYWGIQNNTMPAVDQGFRDKISAYNQANGTNKIWAAGVIPGYDDTRVPGRVGTYIVPRNDGATYTTSWQAAMASNPEWITITSFNEWYEGAQIEPSVSYDMQYLTLTQQFTTEWHG